jgi:hypothetical protein
MIAAPRLKQLDLIRSWDFCTLFALVALHWRWI